MKVKLPRFTPAVLALAFLLTSCGGGDGGGGSDDSRLPVKPAPVTVEFPSGGAPAPLGPDAIRVLLELLSAGIDQTHSLALTTMPVLYIDDVYEETISGPEGGSVDVTAISTASGSDDWQYVVFNGYTEDGVRLDGAVLEETTGVLDPPTGHPHRISFHDYTMTMPGSMLTLTGTVERRRLDAVDEYALVANIAIRDGFSRRALYLQDFTVRDVTYGADAAIEVDGVILEADLYGDVLKYDVKTLPGDGLRYAMVAEERVPSRGSLQLAGDGSAVLDLAFLNAYLVHVTTRGTGASAHYRVSVIEDVLADNAIEALARPIATASEGATDNILVGTERVLDGRFSVGRKNVPLTYAWELVYGPADSTADIVDPMEPVARIIPDIPGDYLFRLKVSDGANEADDLLEIHVADPNIVEYNWTAIVDSRGQLIPDPEEPEQWVIDTRAAMSPLETPAPLPWAYEILGEADYPNDVAGQVSAHVDLTYAQGLRVDNGCCRNGMEPLKEELDLPDFAPRLHEPFEIMNLQMLGFSTERGVLHAELGDVNDDGFDDVLATPTEADFSSIDPDENRPGVYVRYGLDGGGFGEMVWLDAGNASRFAVGDVDGDGVADIVAGDADCTFDVVYGRADGFSPAANVSLNGTCTPYQEDRRQGRYFVIRDLDNDGQPTIVTVAANHTDVELIDLDASGNVVAQHDIVLSTATGDDESWIDHVVVLDMNVDGLLDVAVSIDSDTGVKGRPVFLLQNADGTFSVSEKEEMPSFDGPRFSIGDFDGDGHDDLAAGVYKSVKIWKSGPGGPVVIHDDNLDDVAGAHHLGTDWLSFEDINDDGDDELLLLGNTGNWILAMDDGGGAVRTAWMLLPNLEYADFTGMSAAAPPIVRDMDRDGVLDVVLFDRSGIFVALGKPN